MSAALTTSEQMLDRATGLPRIHGYSRGLDYDLTLFFAPHIRAEFARLMRGNG